MVDINDYTREETCEYKGELYSARDNGAIMRHSKNEKKPRPLDNIWTFGNKDYSNGYMIFASQRVHIIVATAFYGPKDSKVYVVDHIDTNRCNNRVENLRWFTKLENTLNNDITRKKIIYLCGSIEAFLENPRILDKYILEDKNFEWMRTVTKEEADNCRKHMEEWIKRDTMNADGNEDSAENNQSANNEAKLPGEITFEELKEELRQRHPVEMAEYEGKKNSGVGDWIYSSPSSELLSYPKHHKTSVAEKKKVSLKEGSILTEFSDSFSFPLCPTEDTSNGLYAYAKNLEEGKTIAITENGEKYIIESLGWTWEWDAIEVECKCYGQLIPKFIYITFENNMYVHRNGDFRGYYRFCDSPNVLQSGAVTHCYFPLCPKDGNISLEEYANILQPGTLFEKNNYGDSIVIDREITVSEDGSPILYVGVSIPSTIKPYGDMIIYKERGKIIHQIGTTYFDKRSIDRTLCKIRGQEWDDKNPIIDDYC